MADNTTLNAGSGGDTIRTDEIAGVKYPTSKITLGADGTDDGFVSSANPLPVGDAGGSLTVDNATLSVTGGGAEASALRVTLASDSTGVLSVDDNGGSLTTDTPDGADVALGATTDAAATAGGTGTVSAKLRLMTTLLDALKTAAEAIDDWDESDRAKVNLIVGQAGISAGAGAVAVNTPRVTLAADDPAVVALQTLDNAISGNEIQADVLTQPARARTTDTISAADATDALMNGTTALTPKFASISENTLANNEIVAAVADKKIRVLAYTLISNGDLTVTWKSATTAKSGAMPLTQYSGLTPPYCPLGHFETAAGEALNLDMSAAVQVSGHLVYVEV